MFACILGLIVCLCVAGCGKPAAPEKGKDATEPAAPLKPGSPPPAVVKRCVKPPDIDGDLSDACWKDAEIKGAWIDVHTGAPAKLQPRVYACYDDKNLYLALYNPEPKMKNVVANTTARDGHVWTDDSIEIFIEPATGGKDYFQFIVNTNNVLYDGKNKDGEWNSRARTAVKKLEDAWTLEMAIPLADLGVTGLPKGTWAGNFCRNCHAEGEPQNISWSDTGESFHNPEAFGKLKME
jgi:hypothetical protein